jgi:multiple antibiotic resistance protein
MEHWSEYTRFIIALVAILDPFFAIPVFVSLTAERSPAERAQTASVATATVAAVLLVAALSGELLLHLMGTSLASFRVGGGIVLLLMAVSMLGAQGTPFRRTPEETEEATNKSAVGVVPLGVPLLAGPGAISAVIIQSQRSEGPLHMVLVLGCVLLVCAVLRLTLHLAEPIGRALGPIGLKVANRLLGLILAAIAVEIIAGGLRELFPVLAASGR